MKSFLLSILTLQLFLPVLTGQDWVVPDDKKGKLSTFAFDETTRKAGEKLYTINCMSCHGTPGKGNYLKLVPPPGDPATEKIQKNRDGEIFYKVTEGRGQMPSFKSVLSSNEIWNIISFLRSFNNTYKQEIMPVITSSAYPGAVISLLLSFNEAGKSIVLHAIASKDKSIIPVEGAAIKLFVHRTFGQLFIDEEKVTDKEGVATFLIPDKLPGDTAGNIRVSARFTNEELFGSVIKDTVLNAGIRTIPVSLVAERAMWNNVRKAPVWIILTYSLGLLAAWGFIFYVLMKLRDIFIVGKSIKKDIPEKENI
jgi:mono/diheme cytochrome c family protein